MTDSDFQKGGEDARPAALRETIILLAFAAASNALTMRVVEPLLPQLASEFATSVPRVAGVITGYALGQAAGLYFHGILADRFGKVRVIAALAAASAVASFACAAATSLWMLVACRVAVGLASGVVTVGMAFVADNVQPERLQQVLARFIAGHIAGQAISPFLGGALTALVGWRATFVALGCVSLMVLLLLRVRARMYWTSGTASDGALLSPRRYLVQLRHAHVRRVLFAVFMESAFFFGAYAFLGALMKDRFGIPVVLIGVVLVGFGVGGLIYAWASDWLLARLGQKGCALCGGLLGAAFFAAILVVPNWQLALVCTIGLGVSFYLIQNTLQMKAVAMVPSARGTGVSMFTICWVAGQAAGVAVMGAGIARVGFAWMVPLFAVGIGVVGVGVAVKLDRLTT